MKIAYLYYDFLNLYGESGNIKMIEQILKQNKIKHKILYLSLEDELKFSEYDLVYIGSGTEDNVLIALSHLKQYEKDIKEYISNNKFMFVTGNSLDMFGKCIDEVAALSIFNYKVSKGNRKMHEVFIENKFSKHKILGFINNNSNLSDEFNFIGKNNFYGTYILGPILVRNPHFTKYFMNELTNKKLKYDLKLELKAYDTFIKQFME